MYFWFISILYLCNLECFVIVKGVLCAILGLCNLEYYVLLVYKYYVCVIWNVLLLLRVMFLVLLKGDAFFVTWICICIIC